MSTNVEERVRRALSARAGQVTPGRLQPAVPPTAAPARRSWRSWWPTLLIAAAALVAVVFLVRLPDGNPAPPIPDAPAATVPSTEPLPSSPGVLESPEPSPAATSPAPTASPTARPPEPEISPPTAATVTP